MNFRRAVSILVVFLLLAGVHLFIYAQNISLKYEITDLKVKLSELNSRKRQLASQAAREENLNYVEKAAKEKLKMIYPERIIYILPSTLNQIGSGSREAAPAPK
jgi:cell division protein FtsB